MKRYRLLNYRMHIRLQQTQATIVVAGHGKRQKIKQRLAIPGTLMENGHNKVPFCLADQLESGFTSLRYLVLDAFIRAYTRQADSSSASFQEYRAWGTLWQYHSSRQLTGKTQHPAVYGKIGNFQVTAVPEPQVYALMAIGLLGLILIRHRRQQVKNQESLFLG